MGIKFDEFCDEQKLCSTCGECIYSKHSSPKECQKQFDIDNNTYVTQFELNCILSNIEGVLVDIVENMNFIESELDRR